ncbi:MAG: hypothetical protein M0R75_14535 [Dehalococcoidia bacterium]|nr:hypothetical protein [Dehalococcoidia bacterium]
MERGQPLPRLDLGRAALAHALTLLAALTATVLLVACDSGEAPATPSVTTSTVVTAATPARTPEGAAFEYVIPPPLELPSHVETIDARITGNAHGLIAIDPVTATVNTIWAENERPWDIDVYPSLAGGGDGVWLSWDNGTIESIRYDLDGNEVDRVPGLWAQESEDGEVVTYYTAPSGEERHYVARYPNHTADLGSGTCCGVIAADGRIAFLGPFEGDGQSLLLYDPATREISVLADGIGRPAKDGVIYPSWSPSERYVMDFTFDQKDPPASQTILADTSTGTVTLRDRTAVEWWIAGREGADWIGRLDGGDLQFTLASDGTEALRLSQPDTQYTGMADLGGAIAAYAETPEGMAAIVYDLDGNELGRWVGEFWYVTQTADGLAAIEVAYQPARGVCASSVIDHPNFEGEVGCVGTGGRWSPDGRFFASLPPATSGGSIYIFDAAAGEGRIYETGRDDLSITWSADSSRLVVRIGGPA